VIVTLRDPPSGMDGKVAVTTWPTALQDPFALAVQATNVIEAASVSLTTTDTALPGPRFVTEIVYVTSEPLVTVSADALAITATSAWGLIAVTAAAAELSPVDGSPGARTWTRFAITVPCVTVGLTRATSAIVAESPAARLENFTFRNRPAPVHAPAPVDAQETKVVEEESVSVTTTDVAADGPSFATTTVHAMSEPIWTGFGEAVFRTLTSPAAARGDAAGMRPAVGRRPATIAAASGAGIHAREASRIGEDGEERWGRLGHM